VSGVYDIMQGRIGARRQARREGRHMCSPMRIRMRCVSDDARDGSQGGTPGTGKAAAQRPLIIRMIEMEKRERRTLPAERNRSRAGGGAGQACRSDGLLRMHPVIMPKNACAGKHPAYSEP
jgi:hypothetical protein